MMIKKTPHFLGFGEFFSFFSKIEVQSQKVEPYGNFVPRFIYLSVRLLVHHRVICEGALTGSEITWNTKN
jgi:hypothetical protein